MKESIIKEKSKKFALRVIRLYQVCSDERKEKVLSTQLLRSGTSIGANVNEALCAISRKEFLAKMYIAYKESAESLYWLELLRDAGYITESESESIMSDCEDIKKILSSITKTVKETLTPNSKLLTPN